ncbi:MAG: permease [Woeseiaceae bacterium]|nr:permease [Woeseiaceae bacterium]
MHSFLDGWHAAATTTVGLFWMAFWAFGLGYLISSMIQVFVTRERMKQSMGDSGPSSVGLGAFFGFVSSSCSFAALATTRSLFAKGAGIVPSLAFLLASTNLVVELGIVIAVFLGWQFVVGEYVGGLLLILLMWLVVRLTSSQRLVNDARERARAAEQGEDDEDRTDWKSLIASLAGWRRVADRYFMEWHMVWKDITIGFTVAGIIAAFVPRRFFETLFIGAGSANPQFHEVLLQSVVGPVAAFFTFIGSMGNIPLAAVLYENGVSFAGVMAFIFSDLVVLPVLRIQAQYYGWRMALYVLCVFLVILVATAIILHYGFALFGSLPDASAARAVTERDYFEINYTLVLNALFFIVSALFVAWRLKRAGVPAGSDALSERVLFGLACAGFVWLIVGLSLPVFADIGA